MTVIPVGEVGGVNVDAGELDGVKVDFSAVRKRACVAVSTAGLLPLEAR